MIPVKTIGRDLKDNVYTQQDITSKAML
uniref:Uncharacterized protein n=1 Tax=Anguilla anguilla TaxID=7936 RepID=A0A0E9XCY4_ANGAN